MINVVAVGRIKEKSLQALIDEYLKRISGYTKINIIEVADEANDRNDVREVEGQRILKQIKDDAYVILLDLKGREIDSVQFSKLIGEINTYRSSNITFVIGGSLGVSQQVIDRADYRLKISDMTFPHNLARLIILEQIYRAYKIANNETYHK
ncbi:MAG: 23S rRNA (pseudouridine(1915)-N(3))-methyltransferase RlmH [Erysipelotrichaceae bacterium]|nr:23S rRNA (pseudouridine(1915)-N(3))-methyltransferase RlmH [Erysipelotrichaceae bacterium]